MSVGSRPGLPREIVHRATGERIVFLRTAQETAGALLEMDDFWARTDHRTPLHIHPAMEERWQVISGRVRFEINGASTLALPGDTVIAPAGAPHCACSVGSEPARLRIQMCPALRWQEFVERLFRIDPGASEPDQLAALMRDFSEEIVPPPAPPSSTPTSGAGGCSGSGSRS